MSAEMGTLTGTVWVLRGTIILYGGYFFGTIVGPK